MLSTQVPRNMRSEHLNDNSLRQSNSTLGKSEAQRPGEVQYIRSIVKASTLASPYRRCRLRTPASLSRPNSAFSQPRSNLQYSEQSPIKDLRRDLPCYHPLRVIVLAVRHALLVSLTRPLSLSTLRFGILISRRTPIFARKAVTWVVAGGVLFLATLGQTASWTTLLTPNKIVIPTVTPLEGGEIDLNSSVFSTTHWQFYDSWNGTNGAYNLQNYMESALSSVVDTSGTASANSAAGHVSVLDFAGRVHVGSTGGRSDHVSQC
ncbi:hypothetical protein R3P38DRAFT_3292080 [Favolaschia claudopus]|uniref:Uncharacterized protein n=1 Tax=Favolaschia claudopus TaxID=2862362 RepID=A0AAV9ZLE9_9AGAR